MFTKILIANRGEIACRVIKTARRMGIRTVAVYSEADANARHVRLADEAVCIGPAPPRESYLVVDKIIDARAGVPARRPSIPATASCPRTRLRRRLRAGRHRLHRSAGGAIRAMGSKSEAKTLMEKAGVPLTPGYHGDNQDPAFLQQQADAIGYPVLIKAGGRRRRQGHAPGREGEEFAAALASCQREAQVVLRRRHVLIENTCSARATSRSRSSATRTAIASTCSSATARCSAATRRCSKKRRRPA
jgi:3-methylcrotonyl-CoA carboxylase alpha subunit